MKNTRPKLVSGAEISKICIAPEFNINACKISAPTISHAGVVFINYSIHVDDYWYVIIVSWA